MALDLIHVMLLGKSAPPTLPMQLSEVPLNLAQVMLAALVPKDKDKMKHIREWIKRIARRDQGSFRDDAAAIL